MISKKEINIVFISVMLIIVAAFFYILFGMVGIKVFTGLIVVFFFPVYLLVSNLNIEEDEKIIFSFFISLGLFPTVVYYCAILISSMRSAIILGAILLIITGVAIRRYIK